MRILIVEDQERIARTIKRGLEDERYAVDIAFDGEDGYGLASTTDYDCLILDVMLPGMDGINIARQLRKDNIHTPILLLTARSETRDVVHGLDSGADDYLTKPFSFDELLARVRALTRRPADTHGPVLSVADLSLDPQTYVVTRGGKQIKLSSKEYALLRYLMQSARSIRSKSQIIDHVWDYDADILPNTVEVFIRNLRNKIDVPFPTLKPLIRTVRGFGYQLTDRDV